MSFLENLTAFLPIGKKEQELEYFFAANIGVEKITAALWVIEGKELQVLDTAAGSYSSKEEIIETVDKLLDQVLGLKEVEPQKILFGVPDSWILDDNLKDEHLKTLRSLVKELELSPMAYVATSHALVHFLEKREGIPATAILVGFEKSHLIVTVVRAGKIDGVKVIKRGEISGSDIEKALLTFVDVETLPSKILIYGEEAAELKPQLLSFSWMSKLSFLHFPKIDVLGADLEIKSVCLAGGSEINGNISFKDQAMKKQVSKVNVLEEENVDSQPAALSEKEDLGFVVGDVTDQKELIEEQPVEKELVVPQESFEIDDFENDLEPQVAPPGKEHSKKFNFKRFIPKGKLPNITLLLVIVVIVLLAGAYVYLPQADVRVYVEPRLLEKEAEVIADPNQKDINEETKVIPGQIVETEVSGTAKETATGKKQIGDPAKGTVVIINNTDEGQSFSAGTILTTSNGLKFKLDNTASVSATLSEATSKSTKTAEVTAVEIGADGNITSETNLTIGNYPTSRFIAKTQGNFAGGTSKDVTVVSSDDTERLLAKLSSDLKRQAQQKLQEKYPDKKILEEALAESIVRKSYNKNINDAASEFSLNMTVKYKGTAFDDADLKTIVSKLVTTQVPDGFQLNIAETETQADVAKVEKGGKVIFSAKFRAKLMPRIDTDSIRNQIKFKTPNEVGVMLKGMENVLGSEIQLIPNLPAFLQRLPLMAKNIRIEVGLK